MVVGPRQDPQVAPSRRIVFVVLADSPGPLVASRVSGPGGLSGQRHTDTRGEGPHSLGRGWPRPGGLLTLAHSGLQQTQPPDNVPTGHLGHAASQH